MAAPEVIDLTSDSEDIIEDANINNGNLEKEKTLQDPDTNANNGNVKKEKTLQDPDTNINNGNLEKEKTLQDPDTNIYSGNLEKEKTLQDPDTNGINGFSKTSDALPTNTVDLINKAKISNGLKRAIEKFLDVIGDIVKPVEKEKICSKIDKRIDSLIKNAVFTKETDETVAANIENATTKISVDKQKVWQEISKLLDSIKIVNTIDASNVQSSSHGSRGLPFSQSDADEKLQRKIEALELKLISVVKEIDDWETREVDLEDDTNSAYLAQDRIMVHYMKNYTLLCELQKHCKRNTGRPIHKKLPLEDITKYPELNEAVFKFLNTKLEENCYYFPDFHDLFHIVENVMTETPLVFSDSEINRLTKDVFRRVVSILKTRRLKDNIRIAVKEIEDPADNDAELAKKLEENQLRWKKEEDVFDKFEEKQGDLSSPGSSENENESEIDSEEEEGNNEPNLLLDELLSLAGNVTNDADATEYYQDKLELQPEVDIANSDTETNPIDAKKRRLESP